MSDFTFEISEQDLRTMEKVFNRLGMLDREEAVRKALREGMGEMVKQGKANYLSMPRGKASKGMLAKSMNTKMKKYKKDTVGAYGGFRRSPKPYDGSVAHLIDRGTRERQYISKNGKVHKTGRVQPRRFWTDVVLTKGREVANKLTQRIIEIIKKNYSR